MTFDEFYDLSRPGVIERLSEVEYEIIASRVGWNFTQPANSGDLLTDLLSATAYCDTGKARAVLSLWKRYVER